MTYAKVDLSDDLISHLRAIANSDNLSVATVTRMGLERFVELHDQESEVVAATNAMQQRGSYNLIDMLAPELVDQREAAILAYTRVLQFRQMHASADESMRSAIEAYNQAQSELYAQRLTAAGVDLCLRCCELVPHNQIGTFAGTYRRYKGGADCTWFKHQHIYRACMGCRSKIVGSLVSAAGESDGYTEIFETRDVNGLLQALIDGRWLDIHPTYTKEEAYELELRRPDVWKHWSIGGPMSFRDGGLFLGDCPLMP